MSLPARRNDAELQAQLMGLPALPRDIEKATVRGCAEYQGRAMVQHARLAGAKYVADRGLWYLRELEDEERAMASGRASRIVDVFSEVVETAVYDSAMRRF